MSELQQIDYNRFFASLKQKKAENNTIGQQNQTRQNELFDYALQGSALKEFGQRYVKNHISNSVTAKKNIDQMIQDAVLKSTGYYICGIPGSGKTHILLEFYYSLLRKHFQALVALDDYPNHYPTWIQKTVKYYYASWICDLIRNKQKPIVAKFNLLDDFMVEELDGWMLAGWDAYIEEINRRDCVLIVTSNVSPDDFKDKPQYSRILSRLVGNCKQVTVPTKDRRKS